MSQGARNLGGSQMTEAHLTILRAMERGRGLRLQRQAKVTLGKVRRENVWHTKAALPQG